VVAIVHAFNIYSDDDDGDDGRELGLVSSPLANTVIILPLLVGMFASLLAAYRPMLKFGAAYAAAKRIEKEIFLFRCGVSPYRPVKPVPGVKNHRRRFSEAIQSIWTECADSDLKLGRFKTRGDSGWMWTNPDTDEGAMWFHVHQLLHKLGLPEVYDTFGTLDTDRYIRHRMCDNIYEMQRDAGFYNRSECL